MLLRITRNNSKPRLTEDGYKLDTTFCHENMKTLSATSFLYVLLHIVSLSYVESLDSFSHLIVYNKRLTGHALWTFQNHGLQTCFLECKARKLCKSVNFKKSELLCELRTSTAVIHLAEFVYDAAYMYMDMNSVANISGDICLTSNPCAAGKLCTMLSNDVYYCIGDIGQTECTADPPFVPNTTIHVTNRAVGQTSTYNCVGGTQGIYDTTCMKDGSWTHSNFSCNDSNGGAINSGCLSTTNCYLRYNFTYDNSYTSCYGEKFIRKTNYNPGKYVGVILCYPTRYKLVLGDDPYGTFYNIGDGANIGGDHCELIGGSESSAVEPTDYNNCPDTVGFYRKEMGENFTFGDIGYASYNWFGTWLECGITVPGNIQVYP